MLKIGETLKIIRTDLDLTLEEMSADVITPSYYSKIEKELHRISAEDLFRILEIHSININTFMGYLEKDKQTNREKQISQKIITSFYQGNLQKIRLIKQEIEKEIKIDNQTKNYLLALAESCLYTLDEQLIISDKTKTFIEEKLFKLPNWNNFKLTLYANFLELYPLESNQLIISSILSKKVESYSSSERISILSILLNFIGDCIEEKEYTLAKYYLNKIDSIDSNPENFFHKLLGKYYNEILNIIENNDAASKESILSIIELVKFVGLDHYSDQLDSYLKEKTLNLF